MGYGTHCKRFVFDSYWRKQNKRYRPILCKK